jgi:hypothetical protein
MDGCNFCSVGVGARPSMGWATVVTPAAGVGRGIEASGVTSVGTGTMIREGLSIWLIKPSCTTPEITVAVKRSVSTGNDKLK